MRVTYQRLCCLLLLASIVPAHAEPAIDITTRYYSVYGVTETEILQSMASQSPNLIGDERFHARIDWSINWEFFWEQRNDLCVIKEAHSNVKIIYVYPKLETKEVLPAKLKKRWEQYVNFLICHEHRHKKQVVETAKIIEREISAIEAVPSCSQLESSANALGHHHSAILKQLLTEADYTTHHGTRDRKCYVEE